MTPGSLLLRSGLPARDAWPLDPAIVHLNHGSFGAVPTRVIEAQDRIRAQADRSPVGWYPRIPEYVAAARERVAGFVGADAADTAFVPNASAAATVVCNSLMLQPGSEVLVTNHGYGAVTMAAERMAARTGAVVRTVEIPLAASDAEVLDLFREALTERTSLVVVDQITSPTARLFPTAAITELAHSVGARVLVDGAHAPGLIEDAAAVAGGDWWFGNLHKWPAAPRGSALLVTRADDRDTLLPLIDSWGAKLGFPAAFDFQGTGDVSNYLATPDALEFIEQEFGWAEARTVLSDLADAGAIVIGEALQPLVDEPVQVDNAAPASTMRLLRLPSGVATTREDADALRMRLYDECGVEIAATAFDGVGYLRISVHLYTDVTDFIELIDRTLPVIASLR